MTAPATFHPTDLEPHQVGRRVYMTRRRFGRIDAALVLGVILIMLAVIPARLVVPGVPAVGRPGVIMCLMIWFWWVIVRLSPGLTLTGPQPIRWVVWAFLLSNVVSYAIGHLRGLTSLEADASDRRMIEIAAFVGVILAAADGISNWERLRVVLKVFLVSAVFLSVIGLIQFIFKWDVVHYMYGLFPGLEVKGRVLGLEDRGAGVRVASTTTHYIELSASLATAAPFAFHLARFAPTARSRFWYGVSTLVIVSGVLATISRTGFVAVIIALLVLFPLWPGRMRYNVGIAAVALFGVMAAVQPQLARTFFDMFAEASTDPNVTSRTERYDMVGFFFSQTPWLGRGTGTWTPPQYQYLDNQWLGTALENGIVGVAVLAAMHITAIALAIIAMRRAVTAEDRHLCGALIATQLIAAFVAATFDSFAFSTYSAVLALTVGVCGTLWRFTHPARIIRTSTVMPLRWEQ